MLRLSFNFSQVPYHRVSERVDIGYDLSGNPSRIRVPVFESPSHDRHQQSQRRGVNVVDELRVQDSLKLENSFLKICYASKVLYLKFEILTCQLIIANI